MCGLQLERAYNGLNLDQKAVETALQMDKLYPDDPEVLYHSSQIYGKMAFEAIQRMSVVAPNSPWRYLAAAEVNESQGATAAAIDEYRQVLALDPNRPGIHYRIGRTFLAQGRRSGAQQDQIEALKEFLAELEIDPANANAAYEAGEIYRNSADYANAEKYFQIAINYYPEFRRCPDRPGDRIPGPGQGAACCSRATQSYRGRSVERGFMVSPFTGGAITWQHRGAK